MSPRARAAAVSTPRGPFGDIFDALAGLCLRGALGTQRSQKSNRSNPTQHNATHHNTHLTNSTYSWQVYACLALMVLSVLLGGATDAAFSAAGYAWQLANCLFTAAYALYLSKVRGYFFVLVS